ncbi:uncharacterized protein BCR38DRAFT_419301 [Pseudomassariella vexata]|uniref:Transmembrane protein n=1 Tax=Pseudomassariella vexata TaxID=1141098 RepID=A0A1Y2ED65_9PEZI|nr:uncharacterized protein BCR38DRAFT_419301 [Pseudomassariella vexata]ORY69502.1 hypothetical protein BCR38DRAFT_419301 [Pseudomassariella vexata]
MHKYRSSRRSPPTCPNLLSPFSFTFRPPQLVQLTFPVFIHFYSSQLTLQILESVGAFGSWSHSNTHSTIHPHTLMLDLCFGVFFRFACFGELAFGVPAVFLFLFGVCLGAFRCLEFWLFSCVWLEFGWGRSGIWSSGCFLCFSWARGVAGVGVLAFSKPSPSSLRGVGNFETFSPLAIYLFFHSMLQLVWGCEEENRSPSSFLRW